MSGRSSDEVSVGLGHNTQDSLRDSVIKRSNEWTVSVRESEDF